MNTISSLAIPAFIVIAILLSVFKKSNVWTAFLTGCKKGLNCALEIFPSIFALIVAINLMSSSGALGAFCSFIAPVSKFIGIPGEIFPLSLMRSVSGGGAAAIFQNILGTYGPDSYLGRCAAIIMGSTETTFYTMAVYFAATRVKNTRYCLLCALLADITGSIVGCAVCRLFF